ncbi:hypothetical protein [Sphaerisporangium flaviroseum]|uniref:hypothetical protein n=1 Tax=Sphaerisporangium flaviroseum TaxID=509199 RepID=UPI0031EA7493
MFDGDGEEDVVFVFVGLPEAAPVLTMRVSLAGVVEVPVVGTVHVYKVLRLGAAPAAEVGPIFT